MIKKILSAAGLFLFLISTAASAQLKIGYMNTQQVLSELPQRSEVEQQLNSYIESRRGELEERITDFQNEVAAYQENQENMSEQEIQQREQELAQQEASVQEFQQNLQSQIQERRAKLLEPLYNAMDQAIADVAESNDLDFVLNQATTNGENVIYYSADQQLDITQQVIQRVKETSATN
ncbi:periplasmic chaperone for outer membrane proteins Skp [Fodinibius roseus]|uniref:Periplasmic chaperone for outer membrane proteins Skp n=1 Tax=Fodinibius roseus TaxID=1194090 RepID=A0A1M4WBU9_9BACT|nr:OmpH family outer membrane protein [Fodinibius roseus]SHE78706.1 periplasmic chaperone for outer membrane proteins Skp [Fodinibius roseus]